MTLTLALVGTVWALVMLIAWRRPEHATSITVGAIPTFLIRFTVLGIPTNLLEGLVVVALIAHLRHSKQRKQLICAIKNIPTFAQITILALLISFLASTVISKQLAVSLGILKGWLIIPILLGVTAAVSIKNGASKQITKALLLSGVVTALFAIGTFQGGRASGMYDVPGSLALWLTPLFVLSAASGPSIKQHLATISIGVGIVLTQSATATITLLVLAPFMVRKKAKTMLAGSRAITTAVVVLGIVLLVSTDRLSYLIQNINPTNPPNSISVRLQLWDVSRELIATNPLFGIGLGQFEPHYQQVLHKRFSEYEQEKALQRPIPEFVFRDPHSWPLAFWLNTGLLGLVSFAALTALTIRHGLKSHHKGLALALSAILIHGLAETVYWKNDLAALYWVLLALTLSSLKMTD